MGKAPDNKVKGNPEVEDDLGRNEDDSWLSGDDPSFWESPDFDLQGAIKDLEAAESWDTPYDTSLGGSERLMTLLARILGAEWPPSLDGETLIDPIKGPRGIHARKAEVATIEYYREIIGEKGSIRIGEEGDSLFWLSAAYYNLAYLKGQLSGREEEEDREGDRLGVAIELGRCLEKVKARVLDSLIHRVRAAKRKGKTMPLWPDFIKDLDYAWGVEQKYRKTEEPEAQHLRGWLKKNGRDPGPKVSDDLFAKKVSEWRNLRNL